MEPVLLVTGWLLGWLLLWRVPRLAAPEAPGAGDAPAVATGRISVIVPARDEEHNLPGLLASLRRQTRPADEIIVVDDDSTDRTAAVAADGGARVLRSAGVPAGWTGKSWACWQGAAAAGGDVLVFLDADVTLAPDALRALAHRHASTGGLLSVQPFHAVRRPYEWLSAVFNIMAFMGVGTASVLRPRRMRAAFGPCMVCRRDDYRHVDGHRSVRGEIIEDVALGRRFAEDGLGVDVLGGGRLVTFRMYPDGLARLVEGWSKNIASGAAGTAPGRALGGFLWVTASLLAGGVLAGAIVGGSDVPTVGALAVYVAFMAQVGVLSRQVGTFPFWSWLLFPVLFVFFVAVFVRSLVSTALTRRVVWRGRSIPLGRSRWWAATGARDET